MKLAEIWKGYIFRQYCRSISPPLMPSSKASNDYHGEQKTSISRILHLTPHTPHSNDFNKNSEDISNRKTRRISTYPNLKMNNGGNNKGISYIVSFLGWHLNLKIRKETFFFFGFHKKYFLGRIHQMFTALLNLGINTVNCTTN